MSEPTNHVFNCDWIECFCNDLVKCFIGTSRCKNVKTPSLSTNSFQLDWSRVNKVVNTLILLQPLRWLLGYPQPYGNWSYPSPRKLPAKGLELKLSWRRFETPASQFPLDRSRRLRIPAMRLHQSSWRSCLADLDGLHKHEYPVMSGHNADSLPDSRLPHRQTPNRLISPRPACANTQLVGVALVECLVHWHGMTFFSRQQEFLGNASHRRSTDPYPTVLLQSFT